MWIYIMDIGGSSIKRAIVELPPDGDPQIREMLPRLKLDSRTFEDLREQVLDATSQVLTEHGSIRGIAICTTGSVDNKGMVIHGGHFEGYSNVFWDEIIKRSIRSVERVAVTGDGRASAWAEYIAHGSISGVFTHFVVGTGIGGGIIIGGRPVYGDHWAAGAFGHMKVTAETTITCSCARKGCVETLAAAPAVVRYYEEAVPRRIGDGTRLEWIVAAAQRGDQRAIGAFQRAGSWLGVGLSSVMNTINPGVITIGGGLPLASASIGGAFPDPLFQSAVEAARAQAIRRVGRETVILPARHGNDGGIIGAALLFVGGAG